MFAHNGGFEVVKITFDKEVGNIFRKVHSDFSGTLEGKFAKR